MNKGLWVVILVFLGLYAISCRQRKSNFYIISKEDSLRKVAYTRPDGVVIMPPKVKYSNYTFILDANQNLYFYSIEESRYPLGTYDEREPDSIKLQPDSLTFIPKGTEEVFFKENVLNQKPSKKEKIVCIASYNDTLKGDFIEHLIHNYRNKTKNISLNIRMALPEEHKALKYKLLRKN